MPVQRFFLLGGRRVSGRGRAAGRRDAHALQASQARVIFLRFSGCCWGAGVEEACESGDTAAIARGKGGVWAETLGGGCFSSSEACGAPRFSFLQLGSTAHPTARLIPRLTCSRPGSLARLPALALSRRRPARRSRGRRSSRTARSTLSRGGRHGWRRSVGSAATAWAPPVFRRPAAAAPQLSACPSDSALHCQPASSPPLLMPHPAKTMSQSRPRHINPLQPLADAPPTRTHTSHPENASPDALHPQHRRPDPRRGLWDVAGRSARGREGR